MDRLREQQGLGQLTDPDELAREGDLAIRRMRDDPADYDLFVRWRNEPHVARRMSWLMVLERPLA